MTSPPWFMLLSAVVFLGLGLTMLLGHASLTRRKRERNMADYQRSGGREFDLTMLEDALRAYDRRLVMLGGVETVVGVVLLVITGIAMLRGALN